MSNPSFSSLIFLHDIFKGYLIFFFLVVSLIIGNSVNYTYEYIDSMNHAVSLLGKIKLQTILLCGFDSQTLVQYDNK